MISSRAVAAWPWVGTMALVAASVLPAGRAARALRDDGPNAHDYAQIEQGYYERLIAPRSLIDRAPAPTHEPFDAGRLTDPVDDVREYVLKPNLTTTHKGAAWTTNALGLRDRDYPADKPARAIRVGLVGDSIAAGWGVEDGQGFEPRVERTWNGNEGGAGVEVLNFAVPGHAPGQRWEHFRRSGWATDPDAVIFVGTAADLGWDERRLRVLIPRGLGLDAPVYRDVLAPLCLDPLNRPEAIKAALRPRRSEILAGVYRRVVADCHARSVPVAWLLLPRVGKTVDPADRAAIEALARASGFDRVVDLSDAFEGLEPSGLAIGVDDFHPNARGHALLAEFVGPALGDFVSAKRGRSRPEEGSFPDSSPAGVSPR